jgi:xanthine dehydrogenase accessory factor
MSNDDFWPKLLTQLESGDPAFVALVADNTAHSPGTRGARMMVRPDGSTEGTIGGGIMESDIIDKGVEALNAGDSAPEFQRLYHRDKGKGDKSGLICAGHQTNVYAAFEPQRHLELVEDIVRRVDSDETGQVEMSENGIRLTEEEDLSRTKPPIRFHEPTDADPWRYEEQLLNWKRAAVIGGGHCGFALSRVLDHLGYTVTLFDTRDHIETFSNNPYARHTIQVDDFAEAGDHIDHPEITHVVVMTMGEPTDVRGLLGVIDDPYPYIGVMGSDAKLHKIREDLDAEGVDPELFDKLHAPVGLEMTSNTPDEIAVSISAELLRLREDLFPHAAPAEPKPPAD